MLREACSTESGISHFIWIIGLLRFTAGRLCEAPHTALLVIRPAPSIGLNYDRRPLAFNLARYSWPLYQHAFDPESVRFVLPATADCQ